MQGTSSCVNPTTSGIVRIVSDRDPNGRNPAITDSDLPILREESCPTKLGIRSLVPVR